MLACCAAQTTTTENVVIPVGTVDKSQVDSVPGSTGNLKTPTPEASLMPTRQMTTHTKEEEAKHAGFQEKVSEINHVFTKTGTTGLGMDICKEGRRVHGRLVVDTLFVEKIHMNGLIQDYNDTAEPDSQINVGDQIVMVNNVMGAGMDEKLMKDTTLDITFMKTHEVTMKIPKDGTLGLEIAYKDDKDYLLVKSIGDGSVQRYNLKVSPAKRLKTPARIIAVNGFRGKASALYVKLSTTKDPLEILVSQPVSAKAEIWEA